MRTKKIVTLIGAAALLCAAPLAQSKGYEGAKKKKWGYEDKVLSEAAKEEIAADFERMLAREVPDFSAMECEYEACAEGCTEECKAATAKYVAKVSENPTWYYTERFAKKPASWKVLTPLVEKRYAAASTSEEQRAMLVNLTAEAPYELSGKLGTELWAIDRKPFTEDHVLVFASRGGKPFEAELRAQVEKCNASKDARDVRAAAFLAFHGDAVGKKSLVRAVKHANFEQGSIAQPMVAALALETLGMEGVVDETRVRVMEAALAALDAGDLDRARVLAAQAQYFHEVSEKAEIYGKKKGMAIELAWLEERLSYHCEEQSAELASADEVFALLESVSPM